MDVHVEKGGSVPQDYRVVGAEESPYSVKVRAYLIYKTLPHQWLSRAEAPELYQQHARLPLVVARAA